MKKESISNFYQKYRLYIFPSLVALSSLFLIVFAIYPQTMKLIDNQKAIGDLMTKSKFLETKVSALESINSEDLSTKVGSVMQALPADKDFGNILDLLQQLVTQSGFSISSISLSNSSSKAGKTESFEVKLEVKGAKSLFKNLLTNLENSPRLIRVSTIDFSSNPASQIVDASLVIEVLYSKLPQNFGAEDSPLPQINQNDSRLLALLTKTTTISSSSATLNISPRGKANPFD